MADSSPHPPRSSSTRWRPAPLLKTVASLALVAGLVIMTRASFATHYYVPSGSMRPTIEEGDRLWVNKAAYGIRLPGTHRYLKRYAEPQPGDVVVFDSPQDQTLLVKRVVAGPGDLLEVKRGRVKRNGRWAAMEPTGSPGLHTEFFGKRRHRVSLRAGGGPDVAPLRVPKGHFYMLGDNRGNSADSRFIGPVPAGLILGRVSAIFWRKGRPTWIKL